MAQPIVDTRLRQLLDEADRSLSELRAQDPSGRPPREIMQHLDVLHRDLGRRLHDLWIAQAVAAHEADSIDEITDLELVDSEDPALVRTATPGPLPEGLWVDRLQDLLALLDAPTDHTDAVALALEASRLQWATVGLSSRWAPFPEPIQVALLGLLAARCRWLCEHLAVDLGPRKALDRLRYHRLQGGLAMVVALVPDREPESGSWRDDALHWWDMLTAGLTP